MLVQQRVKVGGKTFIKTYSDEGLMIERQGALYSEALDPEENRRVYFQTRIPVKGEKNENHA